ncbi:hypothetical protein GE09DRAFT_500865 [Coniochaeta sp. 2T2.1]|nr:hypothetical protein GE09DRAFT_500865 [Coniochaeta sp. 2T2.1]
MASFSPYHSGAPYYGVHPGHSAYRETRHLRSSVPSPEIPYYCTDITPRYFMSSPPPTTAARDLHPSTRRVRKTVSSTPQDRRMHDSSMPYSNPMARHTASRRRPVSQVWFVPDPPTWASPSSETQTAPSAEEWEANTNPQTPSSDEKGRPLDSQQPQTLATSPAQDVGSSRAASDQGYPTPPPTPRISRLRTPDIKPMDECRPFCDCCSEFEAVVESRSKMELQCKLRCRLAPRF